MCSGIDKQGGIGAEILLPILGVDVIFIENPAQLLLGSIGEKKLSGARISIMAVADDNTPEFSNFQMIIFRIHDWLIRIREWSSRNKSLELAL